MKNDENCDWCGIEESVYLFTYLDPSNNMNTCSHISCMRRELRDIEQFGLDNPLIRKWDGKYQV